MNDRNLEQIGERLREERLRVKVAQLDMADACHVSRGTLATWEKGAQAPNAAALATMALYGVDVLYVVTGQRIEQADSTLDPIERKLLNAWRTSSSKGRAAMVALANAITPDEVEIFKLD